MKIFYTTRQISESLNKHIKTVQRWIREGRLNAVKINGVYYVYHEEMEGFLNANNSKTNS